VAAESRLKSLLAQQPEAAYLHAALGGVYAEQNQWPSAQQAYFQAFRVDPASAEYAFNLAVSLDQMGKQDLALDYYQRARDLLPKQGGAVGREGLDTRISQLRSALGK
jgi:tetratricopeptide (TPR) repeat protein